MGFTVETFRVLVVDDEVDFLETLVNRLKKRKLEAEGVTSGEAALELMKKTPFDVVILDIKMPRGMDGIQTFRELRKIGPLTEVILLTGHASLETGIEGMKLGAFDYLLKPVKLEELMPKLAAAFEKKAAQEEKIKKARIMEMKSSPGPMSEGEKE
ncbi:MAG TPA: response regulator [Syntrophobacteria bacterium]|nr:response regulator [Syntrophobacteria bacterium]